MSIRGHITSLDRVDFNLKLRLGLRTKRNSGSVVPWGFYLSEDGKEYIPNDRELALLYMAREYLRRSALRDVAIWLSEASGRPISHMGLSKIIKVRNPVKELLLPLHEREQFYRTWATSAPASIKKNRNSLQKEKPGCLEQDGAESQSQAQ